MSPTVVMLGAVGVLLACGTYLLLERGLVRILLGVVLVGNGVNLLLLSAGGAAGRPPILDGTPATAMSDPLPQVMVLTAIVITLGFVAFGLALAHRTWQLTGSDDVQDDVEDRRIMAAAERDQAVEADVRDDPDDAEARRGAREGAQ